MAVTTDSSPQAKAILGTGPKLAAYKDMGSLLNQEINFTQGAAAGDIASTARLFKIPAGIYRFKRHLSFITCSAFGAARTLNIGWEAFVDKDGTAVVASAAGLNSAVDVSAVATFNLGTALTTGFMDFESRGGVWIVAVVAGGTIPAAATLNGSAVFSK